MKKFSDLFKAKVAELDGIRSSEDVIVHFLGEEPENEEQADFIRATNMKYHGTDSADKLLGNYAEIKLQTSDESKTSFIRIDLDEIRDEFYDKGWEWVTGYVEERIRYFHTMEGGVLNVMDNITDYNRIKDSLIIRAVRFNEAELKNYCYKRIGDIALVIYAVVFDDREGEALNTIKVPRVVVERWTTPEPVAFAEIMLNTMKFSPARLYTKILGIEDIPDSEADFMAVDFEMKHLSDQTIPLVTTTRKTNGATALFYPGTREKIADMFDSSFYVAFTSIHEAMIHKAGTISPESIRRHLQATNRAFGPKDTLTNEVYYFNKENGTFTVCEF